MTYGGVIPEITEAQMGAVAVPEPPSDVQEEIGRLVVTAFENREQANRIESGAIEQLESALGR